jgi:putative ABC transport system permease protein
MWRVSVADLRYRSRRFTIAVLATSIAFGLSLLMSGSVNHLRRESVRVVELFDADGFVVADGGSGPFTTTRLLPTATAETVRGIAGVDRADAFVQARDTVDGQDVNVLGLELGGMGWPGVRDGRPPAGAGEVVADERLGLRPGDTITLGDLVLRVAGTSSGTTYYFGLPTVFAPVQDVQRGFLHGQPLATAVVVSGDRVGGAASLDGLRLLTPAEAVADLNRPQGPAIETVRIFDALLWLMAAGVVASMVYLSVLEGARDIAVAKAVGTTNRSLFTGLAAQGLILAALACACGALISVALSPLMPIDVETAPGAYVRILGVGAAVGLVAAVVGLRRAVRVDPALAFGG